MSQNIGTGHRSAVPTNVPVSIHTHTHAHTEHHSDCTLRRQGDRAFNQKSRFCRVQISGEFYLVVTCVMIVANLTFSLNLRLTTFVSEGGEASMWVTLEYAHEHEHFLSTFSFLVLVHTQYSHHVGIPFHGMHGRWPRVGWHPRRSEVRVQGWCLNVVTSNSHVACLQVRIRTAENRLVENDEFQVIYDVYIWRSATKVECRQRLCWRSSDHFLVADGNGPGLWHVSTKTGAVNSVVFPTGHGSRSGLCWSAVTTRANFTSQKFHLRQTDRQGRQTDKMEYLYL